MPLIIEVHINQFVKIVDRKSFTCTTNKNKKLIFFHDIKYVLYC